MPGLDLDPYDPDRHQVRRFRSGLGPVDAWLRASKRVLEAKTARIYVLVDPAASGERRPVLGFFALAAGACDVEALPADARDALPRFPFPCIALAWLGVDVSCQGRGLGKALLFKAVEKSLLAREVLGAIMLIVDALTPEAEAFYLRYGFRGFPQTPHRLFARLDDLAERLGC